METPETRFAEASDGTFISYQVSGEGPVDVVVAIGFGLPVEDQMEGRHCADFVRRLSSFARVIRFDRHGIGMSDPIDGSNTLEQWADDALTVLDAVNSRQAVFFGSDPGSAVPCMMFVASHPERATRLVLFGGAARFMWAPDYPWGWSEAELERRLEQMMHTRLTGEHDLSLAGWPSVAGDAEFQSWFLRARRRGLSPARSRGAHEAVWRSDLRSILHAITMPTLVLYRGIARLHYEEHARYLAEHIRGSRLVELPGEDPLCFIGEVDAVIDEVQEFATGVRSDRVFDRVLATVVFSDIVDSTAQAAALGDRAWHQRLDAHDAMVRRELGRFRGREIKTTGDGFLATFDGPARAIHCGCAIRDGAAHLGIDVRVGLHAGEVELRGDDIGGIAVHTAARVQACAQPGEVYVSRTVVDLVAGSGIAFDDRGEHELKGIPKTWQLFTVDG